MDERIYEIPSSVKKLIYDLPECLYDSGIGIAMEKSENTALSYLRDIKLFLEYLASTFNFESDGKTIKDLRPEDIFSVSEDTIRTYFSYLEKASGASKATIRRKAYALELLLRSDLIRLSPLSNEKIKKPEYGKLGVRLVTDSEQKQLLNGILKNDTYLATSDGIPLRLPISDKVRLKRELTISRNYCICMLLLNTGLRVSELAALDIEDFDPENKTLKIEKYLSGNQIIYYKEDDIRFRTVAISDDDMVLAINGYLKTSSDTSFMDKYGPDRYDYREWCMNHFLLPDIKKRAMRDFHFDDPSFYDDIEKYAGILRLMGRNAIGPRLGERALFISPSGKTPGSRLSVRSIQKTVRNLALTYVTTCTLKNTIDPTAMRMTFIASLLSEVPISDASMITGISLTELKSIRTALKRNGSS